MVGYWSLSVASFVALLRVCMYMWPCCQPTILYQNGIRLAWARPVAISCCSCLVHLLVVFFYL